jgi:predicted nucleotide-binding protein
MSLRRDADLVRELLLRVESFDERSGTSFVLNASAPELQIDGYNRDQVEEHVSWLINYGYIEGSVGADLHFVIQRLTRTGCNFLDSVRDPEIWRAAKEEAERVGGFGIDMLHDIENARLGAGRALTDQAVSRRVFVVHGHDEGARETGARFLERLGFEPIILHEQSSQGRTVIEKVEAHGNVGFAVVLLTPDDEGCSTQGNPQPRARQNVVLELGYFIGRLGRDRVCALKRGEVEIPSDFHGVVYEQFDASGSWKLALGRELRAAGFEIDWNKAHE